MTKKNNTFWRNVLWYISLLFFFSFPFLPRLLPHTTPSLSLFLFLTTNLLGGGFFFTARLRRAEKSRSFLLWYIAWDFFFFWAQTSLFSAVIRARFGEESKQEPSRLRLAVFGPKLSAGAAREREKERPKKKKDFFLSWNLEEDRNFFWDDDDDDVAVCFFSGGGVFFWSYAFLPLWFSFGEEGRKKRAGRLKIWSYQSTYVKRWQQFPWLSLFAISGNGRRGTCQLLYSLL